MKKLMTAFAACALAGAVFAQVESQNIVGYQTQTLNPEGSLVIGGGKYNMLGLNWQAVGGSAYPVQSLFGGDARGAGLTADAVPSQAAQIQVWDGTDYATYYLAASEDYEEKDNVWIQTGEVDATTDTLAPGTGFWLVSRSAETNEILTQTGEVKTNLTAGVTIYGTNKGLGGLAMFANPYPADIALNSAFDWVAAGATKNASPSTADQIQVWDGADYATYYLSASEDYEDKDNVWIQTGEVDATTDVIPAGAGCWYKTVSVPDWTLNLPRPY